VTVYLCSCAHLAQKLGKPLAVMGKFAGFELGYALESPPQAKAEQHDIGSQMRSGVGGIQQ
jgi:hypothetical protein